MLAFLAQNGAGLDISDGGVANLDGCQVYDNVAPWDNGGGLYVDDGGVANLEGCNVFLNVAYVRLPHSLNFTAAPR